jgi:hypothetical protein
LGLWEKATIPNAFRRKESMRALQMLLNFIESVIRTNVAQQSCPTSDVWVNMMNDD